MIPEAHRSLCFTKHPCHGKGHFCGVCGSGQLLCLTQAGSDKELVHEVSVSLEGIKLGRKGSPTELAVASNTVGSWRGLWTLLVSGLEMSEKRLG